MYSSTARSQASHPIAAWISPVQFLHVFAPIQACRLAPPHLFDGVRQVVLHNQARLEGELVHVLLRSHLQGSAIRVVDLVERPHDVRLVRLVDWKGAEPEVTDRRIAFQLLQEQRLSPPIRLKRCLAIKKTDCLDVCKLLSGNIPLSSRYLPS